MKHTPAPWVYWDENNGRPKNYDLMKLFSLSTNKQIIKCYGGSGLNAFGKTDEDIANAKLIYAAPELLEALQSLLDMYVELGYSGDAGSFNPEKQDEVIKARAAISKATGS